MIDGLMILGPTRMQACSKQQGTISTPPELLHQLLPPHACLAWVPVLASIDDKLWCGSINWINPFLIKLLWLWCVITAIVTLIKTSFLPLVLMCFLRYQSYWFYHINRVRLPYLHFVAALACNPSYWVYSNDLLGNLFAHSRPQSISHFANMLF